ncbi:MFS transporter [Prodigiosinella confusarubida]|uniref:MFS transporter n=1 Tax=Serratia sp. (strain ATCC 39006) TaxID=104623 RepID=A0A2I5TIJ1_SERS3|nr:MFS transporter [Serratia sp. ATCC 39006]AUH00059.1 MFS transporter [Serratia sp. ATCC 39006]AUH04378.1 MFS transporter [Serratia sp. ATCC 39006]
METSLFKSPTFLCFWAGQIASSLAFQMLVVGIGWQMYALTNSALNLGLVGLAQFLPQLALTLFAGHAVDQYNRRRIILFARLVMAATVLVLAVGCFTQTINATMIYACSAILGATRAFEMPATQALLPNLIEPGLLSRALALMASAREATVIVGPALGGLIYLLGSTILYTASMACFLLSSLFLFRLRYTHQALAKSPVNLKTLFSGIHFIRRNPVILGSISLDMFAVLLGGATALLPIVAKDILHTGPWGLGLLRCAPALGAVLMSIYLTRRPLRQNVGKIMFMAVTLFGLATILFGLSNQLWLSLSALLVLGASDMISVVIRSTLVQLETPDEMRGRVSAANSIFIGTSNQLGEFESGVTAAWLGVVPAIVLGGVGTLLVVTLWMKGFPMLTQRQTLE